MSYLESRVNKLATNLLGLQTYMNAHVEKLTEQSKGHEDTRLEERASNIQASLENFAQVEDRQRSQGTKPDVGAVYIGLAIGM